MGELIKCICGSTHVLIDEVNTSMGRMWLGQCLRCDDRILGKTHQEVVEKMATSKNKR